MAKSTVVVIHKNSDRASELRLLLEFMDVGQVVLAEDHNWKTFIHNPHNLRAVFVDHLDKATYREVIRTVHKADRRLPLILLEEQGYLPPDVQQACTAVIRRPFRQAQLDQILNRPMVNAVVGGARASDNLVGQGPSIMRLRDHIERVSKTNTTVLVLGESGTGKELVARSIHRLSSHGRGPFVPVNCGAIPENLLESELFGHDKGAFTGAITARRGRCEMAEGGTLFLDEIGDMPMPMQVKLLRVLQERVFERVGNSKLIPLKAKIIAATHRNLEELIETGNFREDLYYRLNVFPIQVPALREHIEDLPALVDHLSARIEYEQGIKIRLSKAALECMACYNWPGNIRELRNVLERLGILHAGDAVQVEDLPEKFHTARSSDNKQETKLTPPIFENESEDVLPKEGIDLKQYLMNLEYRFIQSALREANGVVAHAASLLRMRRTTLVEKIRKYEYHGYSG